MNLPIKISPDPIKEAVIELRFNSDAPPEGVLGIFYTSVRKSLSNFERLPITQIPDHIRMTDPSLIYQPYYRFTNENYLFQFGPKVISLAVKSPYTGWTDYSNRFFELYEKITCGNDIVQNIQRFALRYIDFFEEDIFHKINLNIDLNIPAPKSRLYFRTNLNFDEYNCLLQIGNDAAVNDAKYKKTGSFLDIDTTYEPVGKINESNIKTILGGAHIVQKKLFFSLLNKDFLAALNPQYEN